jgi:RNA polymerase sigma factor (sigma-70 family)
VDGAQDETARFDQLWRDCHARVKRFLVGLTWDERAAEDLLDETFVTVLLKPDRVPWDNPLPWLYAVARNHYRNHYRRLGRRAETALEQRHIDGLEYDGGLGLSELQLDVARAGSSLSSAAWEGLSLRFIHGFDDHQIAEILGTSPANVRKSRSRAVQRLRDALQGRERCAGSRAMKAEG